MSTQNWITITYSNYKENNDIQFVLTEIDINTLQL
jgi:hypothetical protein